MELFDILVPKDNFFRKFHDDVDFSFIYNELAATYSPDMGREAYDPIYMFKYLILKVISKLSDEDLVNEVRVNLAYKFFLDMAPEDMPIDSTTLCKFRRCRLKDQNLTNKLLGKSFELGEVKGLLTRCSDNKFHVRAIIDGTHTESCASLYRPVPALKEWSKKLRTSIYECYPDLTDCIASDSEIATTDLNAEMEYGKNLVAWVKQNIPNLGILPRISRVLNRFDELIRDIIDHYSYSPQDSDARIGHKTADTEFFGYKTQIVQDAESGLILGATVTSGEVGDALPGKEAVESVMQNPDIKIDELIGDTAYSGQPFLELAKDGEFELLAPPHPNLGRGIDGRNGFTFNKDADMFCCPQGHMAISKRIATYKKDNNRKSVIYSFDKQKCDACPLQHECRGKAKTKTFSVTLLTPEQKDLLQRSQTDDFRRRRRERYKIEAKNAHLKNGLGYDKAPCHGIEMMELQCAVTLFVSNIKKIYAKTGEK